MKSCHVALPGLGIVLLSLGGVARAHAQAPEPHWPRDVQASEGTLVVYQPQVDSLSRGTLAGRAAISLTRDGQTEPTFGALWFTARVLIDRDAGTVQFADFKVDRLRMSGISGDDSAHVASEIETGADGWGTTESLARFTATVEAARTTSAEAVDLKMEAPKILFAREPAVLVVYDGQPLLRPMEGEPYERAVNTPFVVILDPATRTYYLDGGRHWYSARDPLGPWEYISSPPAQVSELVPPDSAAAAEDSGPPRRILTATVPSELVVTTGAPAFIPLRGTNLLYISNSDTDLFKDLDSQDYFILLSGRWYQSHTLEGPWAYVRADHLPATFRDIPSDSPKAEVLASVPGTEAAADAMADAAIPQTAAIKRTDAHLDVTYDGQPDFQPVQGADLEYAVNSSTAVLRINGLYYACDQAVWYVAQDPMGPWQVSDSVPRAVQSIPPSNPDYSVKYVDVYDSTPDYVWDGYTPGYVGMYPYYGTVVYGTGWWYPPYVGRAYYWPRPWTWGLHVSYWPWYGWCFGGVYSSGFLSVSIGWGGGFRPHYRPRGWYGGGWFGPGGYRPYYPYVGPRPYSALARYGPGRALPRNIYNRPEVRPLVVARSAPVGPRGVGRAWVGRNGVRPNNVFVSKDGQIRRRTATGWQTREGNTWRNEGADRPTARPPRPETNRPSPGLRPVSPSTSPREPLDRDYRARTRAVPDGSSRTPRQIERPRSGGEGMRGGGGGRSGRPGGGGGGGGGSRGGGGGGGGGHHH
ncbi:MAG TPA: hypothetical protein VMG41_13950 [Gemmatimonadales bacterium]|nr:hypothetical protein [Gemmatimonadales bacterium]